MSIVIGLFLHLCFRLLQSGFLVFVNSSDSDSAVLMTLLTTDLLFSQGHDSAYDYYSDYVASENQLLRGVLLCGL